MHMFTCSFVTRIYYYDAQGFNANYRTRKFRFPCTHDTFSQGRDIRLIQKMTVYYNVTLLFCTGLPSPVVSLSFLCMPESRFVFTWHGQSLAPPSPATTSTQTHNTLWSSSNVLVEYYGVIASWFLFCKSLFIWMNCSYMRHRYCNKEIKEINASIRVVTACFVVCMRSNSEHVES